MCNCAGGALLVCAHIRLTSVLASVRTLENSVRDVYNVKRLWREHKATACVHSGDSVPYSLNASRVGGSQYILRNRLRRFRYGA